MTFLQAPPRLGNQFDDDPLLQEYLARTLPQDLLASITEELRAMGELGGGYLYELQAQDRENEPRLTSFEPWGGRVDTIELSPLWREAKVLAAERGLVATAYERRAAELSRIHQFALVYLVEPSLDVYSCPLAMSDGAARTLIELENRELCERALPHLLSRDPETVWTSGQWMTERIGGSDVASTETVALRTGEGWRLYGTKWFCSAATSEMALTLARPQDGPPGGRGLALFYLELRDEEGRSNGIEIHRLKDKLGTRKVPTAELSLAGSWGAPVAGLSEGVRNITSMLNITRVWNSLCAVAGMRRALALVTDYARRRTAFGAPIAEKPLHVDTVAGMQAQLQAAFLLAFRAIELLGRKEAGAAGERDLLLLRLMTPIVKLVTGKQAVALASEALECFGGAGYVEDTGLPRLVRDAQVLPIWEGTTNVLSLDVLRALSKKGTFEAFAAEVRGHLSSARAPGLTPCVEAIRAAMKHASDWIARALEDPRRVDAGARRYAMTLGRTLELALLVEHAQWCLDNDRGGRSLAAARRFAVEGVDLISDIDADESATLVP